MAQRYVVALSPWLDKFDHPGGLTGFLKAQSGFTVLNRVPDVRFATVEAQVAAVKQLRAEFAEELDIFEELEGDVLSRSHSVAGR